MLATGSSPDFGREPHLGWDKRVLLPCMGQESRSETHGRGAALFKGRPNRPEGLLDGCDTDRHMRGSAVQHHGAVSPQPAQHAIREAGLKGSCKRAA